jgi:hypothetical protein
MARPRPFHRRCDTVQSGRNVPTSQKQVVPVFLNRRYSNILSLCHRKTCDIAKPDTAVCRPAGCPDGYARQSDSPMTEISRALSFTGTIVFDVLGGDSQGQSVV